jgi:hypothetical protein
MSTVTRAIAALGFAAALAFTPVLSQAAPVTANGFATAHWKVQPTLKFTLTPNYASGFGTVKAAFGAQSAPAPGGGAAFGSGAVDFGNVQAGSNYLYKYAAHLNVVSNATGFNVYGEGTADFTGTGANAGNTLPINQTIFFLKSTDGVTPDSNTGYSPAQPFSATAAAGAQYNNPAITYTTYPMPLFVSPAASGDLYYDYQLKVNSGANLGTYFVYITYTVVST